MTLTQVQKVRFLYKTILKLHRGLPVELKDLGNNYARDEFKRHKMCNPAEAAVFINEWTRYAVTISEQLGLHGPVSGTEIGCGLGEENLNNMRDDQIQQLYDLLNAATAPKKST